MNLPPPNFVDDTPASSGKPEARPPELKAAAPISEKAPDVADKGVAAEKTKEPKEDDDSWPGLALEALKFPFRGLGSATVLTGMILAVGIALASWVPIGGPLVALFGWFYFASYSLIVVEAGISGKNEPPDWPEFSNLYETVVVPAFQVVGVLLLALLPGLLLSHFAGEEEPAEGLTLLGVVGLAYQWLYLPMGMAGLAVSGAIGGALPHRIWPAILRSFPEYGKVFAIWGALWLVNDLASVVLSWVPLLGGVAAVMLSVYVLVVQCRFTATMYLRLQDKIKF
jgi:hypothetical protein